MIMPFLRLVVIYIAVILATVLFFNRDTLMPLVGMQGGADTAVAGGQATVQAQTPPATEMATSQPGAMAQPASIQTPTSDAAQPPKYPTEDTAKLVLTTPGNAGASSVKASIETRLSEARQAYWKHDMAGAEARFKGLVSDAPENADIRGELGNLYYMQRRMAEAADMYHQAGLILIKDGNRQQVWGLIGVLQSIAPAKATELRNRLTQ